MFFFIYKQSAGCPDEWVKLLESCYLPNFNLSTWENASQFCTSQSGHLAAITSQAEQDDVIREFNASLRLSFWLGGRYDETIQQWSWSNGEPWSYSNIGHERQPGYTCLNVYYRDTDPMRFWVGNDCNQVRFSLCEKSMVL